MIGLFANYIVQTAHKMQKETHRDYSVLQKLIADVFAHLPLLQCYNHINQEIKLYEDIV
jgi:HPt (histidine-containing phosphotransfer) domain-containing protein